MLAQYMPLAQTKEHWLKDMLHMCTELDEASGLLEALGGKLEQLEEMSAGEAASRKACSVLGLRVVIRYVCMQSNSSAFFVAYGLCQLVTHSLTHSFLPACLLCIVVLPLKLCECECWDRQGATEDKAGKTTRRAASTGIRAEG